MIIIENNITTKIQIDFLVYTSFGIKYGDSDDVIIDILLNKSFKDATIQGAFNTKISGHTEISDGCKDSSKKKIYSSLSRIKSFKSKGDYNKWHKNLCVKIVDLFNKPELENNFTIGNAQKWINMFMKYWHNLSKLGYLSDNSILNIEMFLHIPVDSYILEGMWYLDDKWEWDNQKGRKSILKKNKKGAYQPDKVRAWSTWDDYSLYKNFQDNILMFVPNGVSPAEWETRLWIIVSKYKKDNDKAKFLDEISLLKEK